MWPTSHHAGFYCVIKTNDTTLSLSLISCKADVSAWDEPISYFAQYILQSAFIVRIYVRGTQFVLFNHHALSSVSSICWPWTSSSEVTFISSPKAVELHTASGSIGEHINGLRTHTWIIVELQPAGAQIVICNYWVHEQLWNSCVAICRQPLGYCSYIDIVAVWSAHAAGSSKQKVTKNCGNKRDTFVTRQKRQTNWYIHLGADFDLQAENVIEVRRFAVFCNGWLAHQVCAACDGIRIGKVLQWTATP